MKIQTHTAMCTA